MISAQQGRVDHQILLIGLPPPLALLPGNPLIPIELQCLLTDHFKSSLSLCQKAIESAITTAGINQHAKGALSHLDTSSADIKPEKDIIAEAVIDSIET